MLGPSSKSYNSGQIFKNALCRIRVINIKEQFLQTDDEKLIIIRNSINKVGYLLVLAPALL